MAQDQIHLSNFNEAILKQIVVGLALLLCFIIFLDSNFSTAESNTEFINDFKGSRSNNGKGYIFIAQTPHKKYKIPAGLFNVTNPKDPLLIYRSKITGFIQYYGLKKPNEIIIFKSQIIKDDLLGLIATILGIFIATILHFNKRLAQNITLQGILVFLIIISLIFLRNYFNKNYLLEF
ncbi:hypothetical protein ACS5PU_01865 [Pedobacter sp. GSP4]|uniref:hypothetical protein n=1 Tax=Pedobacter sp. GSP4 TaxID=3453716 RepID=UPI003EEB8133